MLKTSSPLCRENFRIGARVVQHQALILSRIEVRTRQAIATEDFQNLICSIRSKIGPNWVRERPQLSKIAKMGEPLLYFQCQTQAWEELLTTLFPRKFSTKLDTVSEEVQWSIMELRPLRPIILRVLQMGKVPKKFSKKDRSQVMNVLIVMRWSHKRQLMGFL